MRLRRVRQQGADGCTCRLPTVVAGRSCLLHAASFLHSRTVTCVSTCIGKPASTFKSLFWLSLCCCPNTSRFDRNKLISSPAQRKIVRTLPVKAEACFHAPPSQNPAPARSVIRPVRCMLTSLFPCRSLHIVDLHSALHVIHRAS